MSLKSKMVSLRTVAVIPSSHAGFYQDVPHHSKRPLVFSALIGSVLPLTSFGSSIYSTPMLLLFRLFYNAAPFDLSNKLPATKQDITDEKTRSTGALNIPIGSAYGDESLLRDRAKSTGTSILDIKAQYSTTDFLSASRSLERHRVVSLTWVKALSSPLSHEFVQFIVEDPVTRRRHRVVTERHEDGDWVHVGLPWDRDEDPHYRFSTPLPLLSISFAKESNSSSSSSPSLRSLAQLLADVTMSSPAYNPMKQMCWWFAETVFERTLRRFGGEVKGWKYASLRYSLVFRTALVWRGKLTYQAQLFRRHSADEMDY